MHPIYDSETLRKAAKAHFEKDFRALLEINLSVLEKHPQNEFLLWHIADNYLKLGDIEKATEFAGRIKDSAEHREDILFRAIQAAGGGEPEN